MVEKCERLELSLLSRRPAEAYVERTEEAARPEISSTPIAVSGDNGFTKTKHMQTLEEWNKLTAEQQDRIIATGQCWTPGEPLEVEKRKNARSN